MAFDEHLARRVRDAVTVRPGVVERRMFGSVAWTVGGHIAVGVIGDELMVRLDRESAAAALADPSVRPFDMTGRPMAGFVLVDPGAVESDADLARWVDAGADHAASLSPR